MMNLRFEWDPDKAEKNWNRHQVSFEEAVKAFFDPNALEEYDVEHSHHEERFNLIGFSSRRLLFVVYTESEANVIRIISARRADRKLEQIYEK